MKYVNFNGCGNCKLNGACRDITKYARVVFLHTEAHYTNGRRKTVFSKGQITTAKAVIKGDKVYCIRAKAGNNKTEEFIELSSVRILNHEQY